MPPVEVRPWDRQDGETELQFEAFQGYLRQSVPRRLAHSSVRFGTADLSRLYSEWRWSERVLAFDRHVSRIRDEEREALIKQDEKERTAKMLGMLEGVGEVLNREISKLLRDSLATEASGLVKPSELNKLLGTYITMQRLIHGESTENVTIADAKLERLSVEEIRELQRIHAKMTEEGDGEGTTH